ncbi:MAG: hypothetical protein WBP81_07370 [Solirubrobacteraceae bacterium]
MRDASEQMRFNECERGDDRGRRVPNVSEFIQRRIGVPLRQADHRTSVVNGTHLRGLGGESGECCARLIWHPKRACLAASHPGDPRRESVHTCE